MRLVRLIYASTSVNLVKSNEVNEILEKARIKNAQNHITGMLLAGEQHFLQCLEGKREDINALYNTISRDPRHRRVEILQFVETTERDFTQWSMHLVLTTRKNAAAILRFAARGDFEPHTMAGQSAYQLLLAYRDQK